MKSKSCLFDELLIEMGKCDRCSSLKNKYNIDKSLINIYMDFSFCREIPSIWTDWYNRLDSKIMIIGQDWGPYDDMNKLYKLYNVNKSYSNWVSLIESEKSLTKRNLTKFICESSNGKYNSLDDIFITNAIMCARKGCNYRGCNIDLKKSCINCSSYLLKQIEIVRPKVILTLGYYPLLSLASLLNFEIKSNIGNTIANYPVIYAQDYVIIPLYHPAAQINHDDALKQYLKIWKYV